MRITIKTLREWEACSEAVEWFKKTAPEEGWTKAQALKAVPRGDWLTFGLDKLGLANREQFILLACCAARRALQFVPQGEDRPRLAIEAAEANVANNTPQTRAAAAWAAEAAWAAAAGAAGAAEHLAIADDMRTLMRTKKYRMAGRKAGGSK